MKQMEIYFYIQNIFNYIAIGIIAIILIIGIINILKDIWENKNEQKRKTSKR
jgi:hypothetical protein